MDSTALMLWLTDHNIEFEAVFVDHGGDYPHTYEYIKYLQREGFEITILKPHVEGCNTLVEYMRKYNFIPSARLRWCTDKFKLRPFAAYVEKPCVNYLGINYDEKKRVKPNRNKKITNVFPLVENYLGRTSCCKIIEDHNLKVPRKSGCFFCPFQPRQEVMKLHEEYPELFAVMDELERKNKGNFTFHGPVREIILNKKLTEYF